VNLLVTNTCYLHEHQEFRNDAIRPPSDSPADATTEVYVVATRLFSQGQNVTKITDSTRPLLVQRPCCGNAPSARPICVSCVHILPY